MIWEDHSIVQYIGDLGVWELTPKHLYIVLTCSHKYVGVVNDEGYRRVYETIYFKLIVEP